MVNGININLFEIVNFRSTNQYLINHYLTPNDQEDLYRVGAKSVLSFSVWFSFDEAPLLIKRNAVAQDLVIFIPEIFCVLSCFDLVKCRITRLRQFLRRLGHLRLEDHDTGIFLIVNHDVASPLPVLSVGFYRIVEAGQHIHAQCFAEAPGASNERDLGLSGIQEIADQAGLIYIIPALASNLCKVRRSDR